MRKPDRPKSGVIFRCAIYTRKSSDDGLEQEFNSLDAQREACEAYVTARFFTICSSYAPILNQRREISRCLRDMPCNSPATQSGDEMAGQSDIEWSEDVLDQ